MAVMIAANTPPQQVVAIVSAQVTHSSNGLYGVVGVCSVSPKAEQMEPEKIAEGYYSLSVRAYAENIFSTRPLDTGPVDYENARVDVLQRPRHGRLSGDLSPGKDISYFPDSGYVGDDKTTFMVNIEGYKVQVVYTIKVRDLKDFNTHPGVGSSYCPRPNWSTISPKSE